MAFGPEVSAAAFAVGIVVGMTGVGGGALMMPLLVLLFGVPPKIAVGTDLLFAAVTKMAGISIHSVRGTIDWQVVRRLSLGSVPAALLTGLLVYYFGRDSIRLDKVLLYALGVMLLLSALGVLAKDRLHALGRRFRLGSASRFKRLQPAATVLAGALLGVVVTLTSVGAGALGAAMLIYLYPLRLTPAKLAGTDLMHAIPLACIGGAAYWFMGTIDWGLLGWMLAGSVPGVLLGSHWASRVSGGILRPMLAVLLSLTGVKLLAS